MARHHHDRAGGFNLGFASTNRSTVLTWCADQLNRAALVRTRRTCMHCMRPLSSDPTGVFPGRWHCSRLRVDGAAQTLLTVRARGWDDDAASRQHDCVADARQAYAFNAHFTCAHVTIVWRHMHRCAILIASSLVTSLLPLSPA